MTQEQLTKLLKVGVLLSSERNIHRLLEQILICVMELACCDAGTLYLLDGDKLRFKIMRNNTMKTYFGGDGKDPDLPPVPLKRENVCAMSLLENRTVCIEDVYCSTECDFSGPIRYDRITGYHTQSMLVVPMQNRQGEALGVLQLINALDQDGNVCAFEEEMTLILESIASQAAITIQNVRYIEEIQDLFQSFVRVMSTAVDERTPYNAHHTKCMAIYGERFLDFLNERAREKGEEIPFMPGHREELLMSIWLHDIGKLTTPLKVMNKETRLLPEQLTAFCHRMEIIRLRGEINYLSGKISNSEYEKLKQDAYEAEEFVNKCNKAGFLPDDVMDKIIELSKRIYQDQDGSLKPWLTAEEKEMLSIRKGTLSAIERTIMENHVVITDKLLSQIHFSKELSHVQEWAASHHEYLSGDGYPRHLSGNEIPKEVRIITILDIFDALTADDRPYKPGLPIEKALSILEAMATKEGKLDPELTALFIESKSWEGESNDENEKNDCHTVDSGSVHRSDCTGSTGGH